MFHSRCYGTRTSLNRWDTNRKIASFETVIEAKNRSLKSAASIAHGEKIPKKHVGNFDSLKWNKKELEKEVYITVNLTGTLWSDFLALA